jgi:putative ABC transport system substrate-binding protein
MRRRQLIIGALAAAASFPAAAQVRESRSARVGYLSPGSAADANFESFKAGLRALGYVEGRNLVIETRFARQQYEQFPALTAELVASKIDVLVSLGPAVRGTATAPLAVPVVFMFSGDAVEAGFAKSLARPGGNATGMSYMVLDLAGKRLELLKHAIPGLSRIGILSNPAHPGEQNELKATNDGARLTSLTTSYHQIHRPDDFAPAFAAMRADGCDGFTAFSEALTIAGRQALAALAIEHRLPGIFGLRSFAEAGGLMSYGPIIDRAYAHLATYVDKILRGASPGELPIEQPSLFELVANLGAARRLNIELPANLLARANEVIE